MEELNFLIQVISNSIPGQKMTFGELNQLNEQIKKAIITLESRLKESEEEEK